MVPPWHRIPPQERSGIQLNELLAAEADMDDGKVDALDEMDMAASNLDAMSIDLHGRAGRYGKDLRVARESVAELIRLAANAERIIRNCVNADQLPEGYMHHADGLRDALARVRSS